MAIGARERDILLQFLLEAIIISVLGCFIGLLLGIGGALSVEALTGTMIIISASSIIVAFSVAAVVGIFFGFYPARKAARLESDRGVALPIKRYPIPLSYRINRLALQRLIDVLAGEA